MLRGGPQVSAQDDCENSSKQKQKKKLSFKEPEVEIPLKNNRYLFAGCKSKTLIKPTTKATNSKKTSASVEDLTLEDQALQIAQNVGNAFSDLSVTDNDQIDLFGLDSISADFEAEKETEILDSSPANSVSYQRSCRLGSFRIPAEDTDYLEEIVPPLLDMRGPTTESNDLNNPKNCIPAEPLPYDGRQLSSSTQHQIQLLRYQLDQQNQQTQMAMHQVQLLQDQMDAESIARRRAQEQNNQLMQQNRELLNHIEKLFQQVEDLEKQVQTLEQEKRGKKILVNPESHASSLRKPTTWAASRRSSLEQASEKSSTWAPNRRSSIEQVNDKPIPWEASLRSSGDQVKERPTTWTASRRSSNENLNEKSLSQNRSQYTPAKKSSVASTKPLGTTPKTAVIQNSTSGLPTKKTSNISRPLAIQNQSKSSGSKEKETLRIGDMSPPVQSEKTNPFSSPWKLKSSEKSTQPSAEKPLVSATRSRTGSFSSYIRKEQERDPTKSTLFGNTNNNLATANTTGKKYSSSTSDLCSTPTSIQGRSSLMIEEPTVKNAISNLSISTSKLPRYQPYVGWRRASLTAEDAEQVSAISKDSYKNFAKTSLFNR